MRERSSDVVWQTGVAGSLAIGLVLIGVITGAGIVGLLGIAAGAATFTGLRTWNRARRRQHFLASAMPRAYLAPPR